MFPYGETVTVLTPTIVTNRYGDDAEDWSDPTELEVPGVGVALGGTTENQTQAANTVDSDFDLYFPPDANVTAENRLVVRGLTCNVVGRPFAWHNPFTGWQPGLFVQAQIREGG